MLQDLQRRYKPDLPQYINDMIYNQESCTSSGKPLVKIYNVQQN